MFASKDVESTPLLDVEQAVSVERERGRRKLVRSMGVFAAMALAGVGYAYSRGEEDALNKLDAALSIAEVVPSSPHVVFFLVDDMGFNDIG